MPNSRKSCPIRNRELETTTSQYRESVADLAKQQASRDQLDLKLQAVDSLEEQLATAKSQIVEHQETARQQAMVIANQQSKLSKQIKLTETQESEINQLKEQEKELQSLRQSVQQIEVLETERETLKTQLDELTATSRPRDQRCRRKRRSNR